jgi:hypothetical protein
VFIALVWLTVGSIADRRRAERGHGRVAGPALRSGFQLSVAARFAAVTQEKNRPEGRCFVQDVEATTGVEPVNSGFADRRVRPLRHVAAVVRRSGSDGCWLPLEDSNLGSRIQSPLSYH